MAQDDRILDAYRRWGYLEATVDPLGLAVPPPYPELARHGDEAERARQWALRVDRRRVHAHPRRRAPPVDTGAR